MAETRRIGAVRAEKRGLRQAGESSMLRYFTDGVNALFFYWGAATAMLIAGLILVIAQFFGLSPWIIVIALGLGALCIGFAGWREFRKHYAYFIGSEGERSAARALDELSACGWHVFHDVTPRRGAKWNIDHVLVGPGGLFAIETKNWSKPSENTACVWDGATLRLRHASGAEVEAEHGGAAIAQAARNARDLSEVLREETGRSYTVQGVLVLPNWFVQEAEGGKRAAVRVCNPVWLAKFLASAPARLNAADVALIRTRVELMCRRD